MMYQIYKCAVLFSCVSVLYAVDDNFRFYSPAAATYKSVRKTRSVPSSQLDAFPNQNSGLLPNNFQDFNAGSISKNLFIPSLPSIIQTDPESSTSYDPSGSSTLLPYNKIPTNQEAAPERFPSLSEFPSLESYTFNDFPKTLLPIPAVT
ncbi:hypothetical protein JTE90_012262 [Oedothorax gibbosus]|uniref:Uncharacterized protein n=1 Tax=Oedothorax gibbosus TaxID=931172 RepID=A0AAV6VI47_9ARAC|nr:hypothetical protein JTE90_012262 [Oedothorax gibbosus]